MNWFHKYRVLSLEINFGNNILSTESDINIRLEKVWTAVIRIAITEKYDVSDKMK